MFVFLRLWLLDRDILTLILDMNMNLVQRGIEMCAFLGHLTNMVGGNRTFYCQIKLLRTCKMSQSKKREKYRERERADLGVNETTWWGDHKRQFL